MSVGEVSNVYNNGYTEGHNQGSVRGVGQTTAAGYVLQGAREGAPGLGVGVASSGGPCLPCPAAVSDTALCDQVAGGQLWGTVDKPKRRRKPGPRHRGTWRRSS